MMRQVMISDDESGEFYSATSNAERGQSEQSSGSGSSSSSSSSDSALDNAGKFKAVTEAFTDIEITDEESAISAAQEAAADMGFQNAADELVATDISEVNGRGYYRLQQMYDGIPVFGRTFVVAADSSNTALDATANAMDITGTVSTTPEISQDEINASISSYLSETYGDSAGDVSCDEVTTDNLVIYNLEDPENPVLAYQLYAYTGANIYEVLIDATDGEILLCNSAIFDAQKQVTKWGQKEEQGEQTFTADLTQHRNGSYYSMDYVTNGDSHIYVRIPNEGYEDKVFSKTEEKENADIVTWQTSPDESAVDAMTNVSDVFECFYHNFDRNSFDGNGNDIDVYVHSEANSNNAACYPGLNAIYFYKCHNEDVETDELSFQTMIIGHEFTHGIIAYSSHLTDLRDNNSNFPH